jgi:ubiquinone/menaquinone biosynthesis C-methylase UbiE
MNSTTSTTLTEGQVIHWARLYDFGIGLYRGRAALHRRVVELAAIAPGDRVLDAGCGPGRVTLAAALAAGPKGETLGIDPAPEMVALATRKAAKAGSSAVFKVAGVEAVPAPDDHFDVVLTTLVLHHLPGDLQRRGLEEIFRVLKPNGRFVALDFSATPGHGLGHVLRLLGHHQHGFEHAEHLRAAAAAAGFEPVEVERAASPTFFFLKARKPLKAA